MTPPQPGTQVDDDIYRERFERCFDDHYGRVFAFVLRRVASQDSAEDVVADTFAIAWRRRDRIPDPALPWLYAIAANAIANQHRAIARRQNLDRRLAREAGIAAPRTDPADLFGDRDELASAFAGLDEAEREVLRLVAWEGLSTRDGAQVIGCSPGAFRVRVHRARRKLARELKTAGRRPREGRRGQSKPAEEGL